MQNNKNNNKEELTRFSFTLPIMKCYEEIVKGKDGKEEKKRFIEGVASSTDIDLHGDKMTPNAIKSMANSIKKHSISLNAEHDKSWQSDLGAVTKLSVDDKNRLLMKASLEVTSKAQDLWYALTTKKKQLGLSVGGYIKDYKLVWDKKQERFMRVFKEIELDHIAVTSTPANPKTWVTALAKAIGDVEKKGNLADINEEWSFSKEDKERIIKKGGWDLYKKAHAYIDDEDGDSPELKKAYKLPFCKLINGELKIVCKGVVASMATLLVGGEALKNVSSEDKKKIYSVLAKQYKKFGITPPVYKSLQEMDKNNLLKFIDLTLSEMSDGLINELLTNFNETLMKNKNKSSLESDEFKKTDDEASEEESEEDTSKKGGEGENESENQDNEDEEDKESDEDNSEDEDKDDDKKDDDEEEEKEDDEKEEEKDEDEKDEDEDEEEKDEEKSLSRKEVVDLVEKTVNSSVSKAIKDVFKSLLGEESTDKKTAKKSKKVDKSNSEVVTMLGKVLDEQKEIKKELGKRPAQRKGVALEKDEKEVSKTKGVDGKEFDSLDKELLHIRKTYEFNADKIFTECGKARNRWADSE